MKYKFFALFYSLLLTTMFIFSCKNKDSVSVAKGASFDSLIVGHGASIINFNDPVFIRFKEEIDSQLLANPGEYRSFLKITPDAEGRLSFPFNRVLKFEPEHLKPGTKYTMRLDMQKLFPRKKLKDRYYVYEFKTVPLKFEVTFSGLQAKDDNAFVLKGMIKSNDSLPPPEELKKVFNIKYEGKTKPELKFTIRHNKSVEFEIGDLIKGVKPSVLEVGWDATRLGAVAKGKRSFTIPAKGVFKVMDYKIEKIYPLTIKVIFSNPLNRTGELAGLLGLEGVKQKPEITVQNNNVILKYDDAYKGVKTLFVEQGVKDINNMTMSARFSADIYLETPKPALRLIDNGVFTPAGKKGVLISFEAINLKAVDIEVAKIYTNNILQFLQYYEYDANYVPEQVGDLQFVKKVDLVNPGEEANLYKWRTYAIDLADYVKLDKGAIYKVRIVFRKKYTSYTCDESHDDLFAATGLDKEPDKKKSIWRRWFYYKGVNYKHYDDPCFPAYYNYDHFIQKNIIASDLALTVQKSTDNSYFITVTDLITGKPVNGAKVSLYTYAQQLITDAKTGANGMAVVNAGEFKPHFVVAEKGDDKTFLALAQNTLRTVSEFDVAGRKMRSGLDGYIYGERGVWRPGDTIFLNFVIKKNGEDIPSGHPVKFTLLTPRGKVYYTTVKTKPVGNIYSFTPVTSPSDPTGNWTAKVSVGDNDFYKKLKIETVKPNRMKIKLEFESKNLLKPGEKIKARVEWLNGLPASNTNLVVTTLFRDKNPQFKAFRRFVFMDKARSFFGDERELYNGPVDENGNAVFSLDLGKELLYPGMLTAKFNIKAFEKSGDFSTDYLTKTVSPYKEYTGIKFPRNRWDEFSIKRGKDNEVLIAVVDENGKPVRNREVNVKIYNARWHWWWDDSADDIANYISDVNITPMLNKKIKTGKDGIAKINVKIDEYGIFFIRACNSHSGHCASILFSTGYYGGAKAGNKDFASKLKFQLDKPVYKPGEQAVLTIPAGKGNTVYIALEKDGKIAQTTVQKAHDDIFEYKMDIEKWMFPGFYVHISVVRPVYSGADVVVRRYGIVPVKIEDDKKKLKPLAVAPAVIKPNEEYKIKITEAEKRPMSYTIAVVDEGLLDLTHFKTPDPGKYFYAKTSSGVKTWDIYDYVIQSQPSFFDKIISVGGDDYNETEPAGKKAIRFKPVVSYLGPFYLKAGGSNTHTLKMHNYSGSVRLMVVAAGEDAYGNYEKSIPVKSDLMILPTVPRVLSPGEVFDLPVTVFNTSNKIHDVKGLLQINDMFSVVGQKKTSLHFATPGEKIMFYKLKVGEKEGVGKIKIKVFSGNKSTFQEVEVNVVNPNPVMKVDSFYRVEGGGRESMGFVMKGIKGTNRGVVEISKLPKLEIQKHLRYLLHYPYGCIEQTTSTAFPLVNIGEILEMPADKTKKINHIIKATITRLKRFQLANGGFSYWPGQSKPNLWGTNYATHFLLEAQNHGFDTGNLLDKAVGFLQNKTSTRLNERSRYDVIYRTYSLMLLAKKGVPNRAAMNYIRNDVKMPVLARWYLALAYAYAGDKDIAQKLYEAGSNELKDYVDVYYTYGSALRDYSVRLMLLRKLDREKEAAILAKDMILRFNEGWHSTQTTAYVLMSLSQYLSKQNKGLEFVVNIAGKEKHIKTSKSLWSVEVNEGEMMKPLIVQNLNKKSPLFVNVISFGKPLQNKINAKNKNIEFTVVYEDLDGKPLDIKSLKMGQQFNAVVKVKGISRIKDYRNMVVNQVFPSGWEILNWQLRDDPRYGDKHIVYQDIRDDRVYTFLNTRYGDNVEFSIPLVATYAGRYYLPVHFAESMYDNSIYANLTSGFVNVTR